MKVIRLTDEQYQQLMQVLTVDMPSKVDVLAHEFGTSVISTDYDDIPDIPLNERIAAETAPYIALAQVIKDATQDQ